MDDSTASSQHSASLPPELRLRILSLLPPNDLALGGRLSSKDAAQRFSEVPNRTVHLSSQPLPGYVTTATWCIGGAETAVRELTFPQKLLLLIRSSCSGHETNVEFVWQLMQQQLFPELLRTDHYLTVTDKVLLQEREEVPEIGSAAVSSGLAHMLPALEQRCPGLLNPIRTLEAAARHCDLAGLQAAWGLLGNRLALCLEQGEPGGRPWAARADDVWRRMMTAAAGSRTPDAMLKLDWLLDKGRTCGYAIIPVGHVEAWGAAAASGDIARLGWLRTHGFTWGTEPGEPLDEVLKHADLAFLQRMDQEVEHGDGFQYIGERGGEFLRSEDAVYTAASAPLDSAAKLRWLEARGAPLSAREDFIDFAAQVDNNLEAVQLLFHHWCKGNNAAAADGGAQGRPGCPMLYAEALGHVPTVAWLHHVGYPLASSAFEHAFCQGNLPLVRWLLEAGCPRGQLIVVDATSLWPVDTLADSGRLVEAARLLVEAGWAPISNADPSNYTAQACSKHPWMVWRGLMEDVEGVVVVHADVVYKNVSTNGGAMGCIAALEALMTSGRREQEYVETHRNDRHLWYADAAQNGDLGTLQCLQQLGFPLQHTPQVVVGALEKGAPLPVLRWLVGQGAMWCRRELCYALLHLKVYYPSPRDTERQEVEVWLRELLR